MGMNRRGSGLRGKRSRVRRFIPVLGGVTFAVSRNRYNPSAPNWAAVHGSKTAAA